jgi:hypothetical protein
VPEFDPVLFIAPILFCLPDSILQNGEFLDLAGDFPDKEIAVLHREHYV